MSEPASGAVDQPTAPAPGNTPSTKAAYQDLFERSIDSIILLDLASSTIVECNDASEKVFRIPKQYLQGLSIFQFCPESFLQELQKMIRIAARRYTPKNYEIPMEVGFAGQRVNIVADMAISPLKLSDGSEVIQMIFRDITAVKENEAKIQEYIKQIELMATTDGLTGLTNVRQFKKLLEVEHARALRYRSKYAIIFFDIDHFKKYNDQNGHPAGDALLKEFALLLKSCVRATDQPARYGGEEFVILCPETDAKDAGALAERIREKILARKFLYGEKQPLGFVSSSIGVSAFPQDGADPAAVLKVSDQLLYQAKHAGRNRVVVSTGAPAPEIPK